MPLRRYLMRVAVLAGAILPVFPQDVHPVTKRPLAGVMGVSGAGWLDREERTREERPDLAIKALNLKPGMMVADIGAGTGFYTFRIAPALLPGGRVFANDLQIGMVRSLSATARSRGFNNVTVVQGSETDARLPHNTMDLEILVDVYHEFSHPQEMLRSLRQSLKPDGRLVLLEFRKEDPNVPIRPEHEMTVAQAKAEIIPEGFTFDKAVETLPWQHMIFFRPSSSGKAEHEND